MATIDAAAIDNDFLSHITEINRPQAEIAALTKRVLDGLGLQAVMHPLIYEKELLQTSKSKFMFDNKIIHKASFADIFQNDDERKAYYCFLVPELYKRIKGYDLDTHGADVFTHWKSRDSLGEVHSMSMCLVSGCGIFLSDDNDSKQLKGFIERDFSEVISVYNRDDVIAILPVGILKREERRLFTHKA